MGILFQEKLTSGRYRLRRNFIFESPRERRSRINKGNLSITPDRQQMGFPALPCYLLSASKTHDEDLRRKDPRVSQEISFQSIFKGLQNWRRASSRARTDILLISVRKISACCNVTSPTIYTFGKRLKFRRLFPAYRGTIIHTHL